MTRIALMAGASQSVELPGRGSAGYLWKFSVEGPPGIVSITALEGELPPAAELPSSASQSARFEVHALRAGRVRVRFQLRRPWEREPLAGQEVVFEIDVRG